MDESIVKAVHKIANAIYKKKGYQVTIPEADVECVLEAARMLHDKLEEK